MSIKAICDKLLDPNVPKSNYINEASTELTRNVRNGELKIIDIVGNLDPVLINTSHEIRLKGVEILTKVVISQEEDFFLEKEIEVLSEFLCLRLIDHKTMEQPTLECLSYFVDCKKKPTHYNTTLLDFLKGKANIRRMEGNARLLVYKIAKKIVMEKNRAKRSMDGDLLYSVVHLMEGESNPQNLLVCFSIVSLILKNFEDLEPFIDDLFDWLSSYYPVDYTPNESDETESQGVIILRSDLVNALYECFYASQLNSENLQTLLLEKLESNITSTKIESLQCLIKCYDVFPLESIKDYSSSLWTSIRVECLRKLNLVDHSLFETSNRALSALTTKLAEDSEIYFNFISELYDELSIAFRKPEMGLFEPAAILLTSAVQPKLTGFNYILSKILPISKNAFSSNEFRPATGVAHIFEQLLHQHPSSKLDKELNELSNNLALQIIEVVHSEENCLKLLNSMIHYRIDFQEKALDAIILKLLLKVEEGFHGAEESLALLCMNYKRSDVLFDDSKIDCQIGSLLKLVFFYKLEGATDLRTNKTMLAKFLIYLRQLVFILHAADNSTIDSLDPQELNEFLSEIRRLTTEVKRSHHLVNNAGRIHAIVLNKLSTDRVNSVMMEFFSSKYCQSLIPTSEGGKDLTCQAYIPILQWIMKSLVIRNHQLSVPLINLVLNFICSDKVGADLALVAVQLFGFIHSDDSMISFDRKLSFQVFILYKQKFFAQTSKEIQIRYEIQKNELKRHLLMCSIIIQIPLVPLPAYKKDCEWIVREILKILTAVRGCNDQETPNEVISMIYECIESLVEQDVGGNLFGFLSELVELNLVYAKESQSLLVRRRALVSLAKIATAFKEKDLLVLRSSVVNKLKTCLEDRKRIVRQAAAEARLRWVLIGQPVGSG